MVCKNCGTPNVDEARFCYRCGAPLEPRPLVVQPAPPAPAPVPAPVISPPPAYGSSTPFQYYPQPYGVQTYNPAENPAFLAYHPLAKGAQGLPDEVFHLPQEFYSYINAEGRLVLARKAGIGKRFFAGLLDYALASLPGWIATIFWVNQTGGKLSQGLVNGAWWVTLISVIFFFGYFSLSVGLTGQTVGKWLSSTRVMRLDGRKPDPFTTFLRQCLGYTLSMGVCFIGFIWAAGDVRGQTWHDKLARTLVVNKRELVEGRDFSLPPLS